MKTRSELEPTVHDWLHQTLDAIPEPTHRYGLVASEVNQTDQQRGWLAVSPLRRLAGPFSALKLVAAGVIVALFGGFLLAGVLTVRQPAEVLPAAVTDSPSPMTTEELLSGMVTEEVEPRVLRILHDGVRDLGSVDAVDIVAGYDGSAWLLREDELLRLGSDESHAWPADLAPQDHAIGVAPDGTVWAMSPVHAWDSDAGGGGGLRSTDGEEWTFQSCPQGSTGCQGLMLAPDGTVWASWDDGVRRVGYLGATGWQPLDGFYPDGAFPGGRLFVTDAGDVYATQLGWANPVYRYMDGRWVRISYRDMLADVGPDGTVWQDGDMVDALGDLNRFSDGEWASWDLADLPDIVDGLGLDSEFTAAPDGSVWFSLWRFVGLGDPREGASSVWQNLMQAVEDGRMVCDGLARFDGSTLDRFLRGQCISMDIATDGAAWVLASESKDAQTPSDLYVITPETVAATA